MKDAIVNVTTDHLLNGRVILKQPTEGYRAAIDPVFLAAAVSASIGGTVLDVGSGVGAAMLCLAARLPECRVIGIEIQEDLAALANENILLNHWQDRLSVIQGDVAAMGPALKNKKFDHVISNPPFYNPRHVSLPPHRSKRDAHAESTTNLEAWITFCLSILTPKGELILIYPTSSLGRVLAVLQTLKCSSKIFPLWPRVGKPAKRVVIQARRRGSCRVDLCAGLTLHYEDGRYTEEAEAILRGVQALRLE